jgi:hypothetical protein
VILFMAGAAAMPPVHLEVDGLLGMRAGAAATATVEPWPHVELGGITTVTTDVYGLAPDWVVDSLNPKHNLRFNVQPAAGLNSGNTHVSLAVLASFGLELLSFKEERVVPALSKPVVYGTTELAVVGGFTLDLRVRPTGTWGANLMAYTPLPPTPTGNLNLERLYAGLGLIIPLSVPQESASSTESP